MNTEEAIAVLQELIDQIPGVSGAGRYSGDHVRWLQNTVFELNRIFGEQSGVSNNVRRLTWSVRSGPMPLDAAFDSRGVLDRENEREFQEDLKRAQGMLESGIDQLRRVGLEQIRRELGHVVAAGAR